MKLLLVNYEFPPLGAGGSNATWSIAQELTKDGHSVSVLTSAHRELRGFAEENNVRVYRVPALRKFRDRSNPLQMGAFCVASLLAASRIVIIERVEACIAFFTIPSGPATLFLKRRFYIPYVVSLRGGDVPGHMPELDWYHRIVTPIRQAILKSADAIVANSPYLAQRSMQVDPFPVQVIPNGVDAQYFSPSAAASRTRDNTFKFIFVGRLSSEKNLGSLLTALKSLSTKTTKPFMLDLVGDGPQRRELARQAEQLDLSERLRWHGWVNRAALRDLYAQADALVHPSLYEGMSNTILEAMACGLPVIASDIGGNEPIVIAGQTGLLFRLSEPDSLVTAMGALLENSQRAREMGAAVRKRVLSDFCWREVTREYVNLLSKSGKTSIGHAI